MSEQQAVSCRVAAGFNMTTFALLGNNATVRGSASKVPPSSLQPVQPQWNTSLTRLNLTVRAQGAGIVPFTAALQRELVSALLHVSPPGLCQLATSMPVSISVFKHTLCLVYVLLAQLHGFIRPQYASA